MHSILARWSSTCFSLHVCDLGHQIQIFQELETSSLPFYSLWSFVCTIVARVLFPGAWGHILENFLRNSLRVRIVGKTTALICRKKIQIYWFIFAYQQKAITT